MSPIPISDLLGYQKGDWGVTELASSRLVGGGGRMGNKLWGLIITLIGVIREEGKQEERRVGQRTIGKKFEDYHHGNFFE